MYLDSYLDYYRTDKEAKKRVFQSLTVQEIALLNAYYGVCQQAIMDSVGFSKAKSSPKAYFLTNIIE